MNILKSRFRDSLHKADKREFNFKRVVPIVEFSFDDGLREDLIFADILKEYGIKNAVFYIPNVCELSDDEIITLSKDFEIGGHTVNHFQDLKLLNDNLLKREIEDNKRWLEDLTSKKITKFCYPRGRYNARVMKVVLDAGYTEARTTIVLKTSFDAFNKDTTVHFYPRREYLNWHPFCLACSYLLTYQEGETLRFWGHSREMLKLNYLKEFKDLINIITNKEV